MLILLFSIRQLNWTLRSSSLHNFLLQDFYLFFVYNFHLHYRSLKWMLSNITIPFPSKYQSLSYDVCITYLSWNICFGVGLYAGVVIFRSKVKFEAISTVPNVDFHTGNSILSEIGDISVNAIHQICYCQRNIRYSGAPNKILGLEWHSCFGFFVVFCIVKNVIEAFFYKRFATFARFVAVTAESYGPAIIIYLCVLRYVEFTSIFLSGLSRYLSFERIFSLSLSRSFSFFRSFCVFACFCFCHRFMELVVHGQSHHRCRYGCSTTRITIH